MFYKISDQFSEFSRETIIETPAVLVQKIDNFVDTVTGPGLCYCSLKANPRHIFISSSGRESSRGGSSNCGRRGSCSSSVATTTKMAYWTVCLIRQFRCKVCTRLHHFRFDFAKFSGEGLTKPSPTILSRDTPSIRAPPLKSRALRALDSCFALSLPAVLGNWSQ